MGAGNDVTTDASLLLIMREHPTVVGNGRRLHVDRRERMRARVRASSDCGQDVQERMQRAAHYILLVETESRGL